MYGLASKSCSLYWLTWTASDNFVLNCIHLLSVLYFVYKYCCPSTHIDAHPTSWRSILVLSSQLRLGLPNGLFSSGFLTNALWTPLSSPIRSKCPAHLILLDFTARTILGMEYRSFSSSLRNFLYFPVVSSLLGPNTLLNTIFSNTLRLRSSLNVSDQVSHPYKTTCKIIVLGGTITPNHHSLFSSIFIPALCYPEIIMNLNRWTVGSTSWPTKLGLSFILPCAVVLPPEYRQVLSCTVVPPYLWVVIRSETYRCCVKPRITPNAIYNAIFL
jgi:hypothetical protein